MRIRPDFIPPNAVRWPSISFEEVCPTPCAQPNRPVGYVVVWELHRHLYRPVDTTTDPTGFIHVVPFMSLYFFFAQNGCKTIAPPGFDLNPHTSHSGRLKLNGGEDVTTTNLWLKVGSELRGMGALDPGTVVMVQDLARVLIAINRAGGDGT